MELENSENGTKVGMLFAPNLIGMPAAWESVLIDNTEWKCKWTHVLIQKRNRGASESSLEDLPLLELLEL